MGSCESTELTTRPREAIHRTMGSCESAELSARPKEAISTSGKSLPSRLRLVPTPGGAWALPSSSRSARPAECSRKEALTPDANRFTQCGAGPCSESGKDAHGGSPSWSSTDDASPCREPDAMHSPPRHPLFRAADLRLRAFAPCANRMLRLRCPSCTNEVLFPGGMRRRDCNECGQALVIHDKAHARHLTNEHQLASDGAQMPYVLKQVSAGFFRSATDMGCIEEDASAFLQRLKPGCGTRAGRDVWKPGCERVVGRDVWKDCASCNATVLLPQGEGTCPRCSHAGLEAKTFLQTSPDISPRCSPCVPLKSTVAAKCALCCERSGDVILRPCGHGDLCIDCVMEISTHGRQRCPFCRAEISEAARVVAFDEVSEFYAVKTIWPRS